MFMQRLLLDGLVCISMKHKGFQYTCLHEDFVPLFNMVCCPVGLGPVVSLVGCSRAPEK
jgi:hypothetical protein